MIPAGSGFVTLDEDGTACSSDYYLRLTADGGRMFKGEIALTPIRPTRPGGTGPGPRVASASSHTQGYVAANAIDGNASTYWESANNAFPQWWQLDLGAATTVNRLVLKLPPHWGPRTQTVGVEGVLPPAAYTFAPDATITFPATDLRIIRLNFTANTGWPAAQLSEVEVHGPGSEPPPPDVNLARGKPVTASSHTQVYVASNVVDGDAGSYWESANNAFPQWIQVDLGAPVSVRRLVLKLPSHWGSRTQTISVEGILPAAGYTFAPDATITFSPTTVRYLRLNFTANTGWPAGQLAELEAYS